jgi:purine nucleoside phosphorylase
MTETNPSPNVPVQPDLAGQLQRIRQLSALEHDAVMAAIEAARAEMRAEIAFLRAHLLRRSA